jgi:hypothetical protein
LAKARASWPLADGAALGVLRDHDGVRVAFELVHGQCTPALALAAGRLQTFNVRLGLGEAPG